jgi:hypothetical protein
LVEPDDTTIVTPATSYSFISVAEARDIMAGLVTSMTDEQLQFWIDAASAEIATLCNRVFGYEQVIDTFDIGGQRVWLNRWPIAKADVTSIKLNGSEIVANTSQWRVAGDELGFGKLTVFSAVDAPMTVSYKGGYHLPDDAPPELKKACHLLVRNAHLQLTSLAQTGVRQLSHKHSRVTYFDPATLIKAQQTAGGTGTQQALESLLYRYRRIEC